jgi:hypothetical protein
VKRIAIIGNAGGGKSVLARELARALGIPHYCIDDVQWLPGWTRAAATSVAHEHEQWLRGDQWIIDGWGEWDLITARFAAADTIVVVDFPFDVHVEWAMNRQAEVARGERTDWPPAGCSATGVEPELLRAMRYVDEVAMPRVRAMLADDPRVVVLRSPEELDAWREYHSERSGGAA